MENINSDINRFLGELEGEKWVKKVEDIQKKDPLYDIELYFDGKEKDKRRLFNLLKKHNMAIASFDFEEGMFGIKNKILYIVHQEKLQKSS